MAIIHTGATERAKPELSSAISEFDLDGQGYLAEQVMPEFRSPKQEGKADVIRREDVILRENTRIAHGATYPRGHLRTETTAYNCLKYGAERQVTDEDRHNYKTSFDVELTKTRQARHAVAIEREIRVAEALFNTTTWAGAALYTDNSGAPWDAAASDIIAHVTAAIEKVRRGTGVRPNALICSTVQVNNMTNNTGIKARFPGAVAVTRQMILDNLAAIFGLGRLIEAQAVYNSAGEGLDAVISDIWSDDYALVAKVVSPGAPLDTPSVARTIRWDALTGMGIEVVTYRESQTDSDIIKVREYIDELLIEAALGHLMKVDA